MAISTDNKELPLAPQIPTEPYYNIISNNGSGHFLLQKEWNAAYYTRDGLAYIICNHKKKKAELVFFSPLLFEKVTPDAE